VAPLWHHRFTQFGFRSRFGGGLGRCARMAGTSGRHSRTSRGRTQLPMCLLIAPVGGAALCGAEIRSSLPTAAASRLRDTHASRYTRLATFPHTSAAWASVIVPFATKSRKIVAEAVRQQFHASFWRALSSPA